MPKWRMHLSLICFPIISIIEDIMIVFLGFVWPSCNCNGDIEIMVLPSQWQVTCSEMLFFKREILDDPITLFALDLIIERDRDSTIFTPQCRSISAVSLREVALQITQTYPYFTAQETHNQTRTIKSRSPGTAALSVTIYSPVLVFNHALDANQLNCTTDAFPVESQQLLTSAHRIKAT